MWFFDKFVVFTKSKSIKPEDFVMAPPVLLTFGICYLYFFSNFLVLLGSFRSNFTDYFHWRGTWCFHFGFLLSLFISLIHIRFRLIFSDKCAHTLIGLWAKNSSQNGPRINRNKKLRWRRRWQEPKHTTDGPMMTCIFPKFLFFYFDSNNWEKNDATEEMKKHRAAKWNRS